LLNGESKVRLSNDLIFYYSEMKKLQEQNYETLKERKEDALSAIQLMNDASLRKAQIEKDKDGLVITKALYGAIGNHDLDTFVDVTIPIQYLVNNSQLHVAGGHSKSNMNGVQGFKFSSMTHV
jgi:DnaJ family protein C protein 11